MRIAVISDIHANFEALRAISGDLMEADTIVCLGDLLGYHCQVNETLDWVRQNVTRCVLGNHDHFVLYGCPESVPEGVRFGVDFAARTMTPDNREWLAGLPMTYEGIADDFSYLLAHGSPWNPLDDYLYEDSAQLEKLKELDFNLIAFGQTHRYLSRRHNESLHLNPGSVGQSRDLETRNCACAVMIDTTTFAVDRIIRQFDADPVIRIARRNGCGDWIGKYLGGNHV